MLAVQSPGVADAETITYTTTPFTGTTTDYTNSGTYIGTLPFTNVDGSSVVTSQSQDSIQEGDGFSINIDMYATDVVTYTRLPTGITEVGFAFNPVGDDPGDYLASAEFQGPGGFDVTYTGSDATNDLTSTPYMGFVSTNAFTSVILTFEFSDTQGTGEITS